MHSLLVEPMMNGIGLYNSAGRMLRISPHRLLLTHHGRVVEPNLTLRTQGIVNDSTVFAVKGCGGGKTTPCPPGLSGEHINPKLY